MPTAESLVQIDGAHGEGGGGLLRSSLLMSALTQLPVHIRNVRGGSKFPGLDAEDVVIIRALTDISAAETEGVEVGGNAITFRPTRRPHALNGRLGNEIGANGRGANANIVLAALGPVLARTGAFSSLSAEGETYGARSLGFDSFTMGTLAAWRRCGLYAEATLERAGFGRESDGEVRLDLEPSHLTGLEWNDRGALISVRAVIASSGVAGSVGERAVSFLKKLANGANLPMQAEMIDCSAKKPGCHITVMAQYERGIGVGAAMGTKGQRVESLCQEAFEELFDWQQSPATVDPYLIDQLLIPMVLAEGDVQLRVSRLTSRFLTAVWAVRQFTPIPLVIKGTEGNPGIVSIKRG